MVKHLLGVAYELLNRSQILHFIIKPMGAQVTLVNVTVVFARYFLLKGIYLLQACGVGIVLNNNCLPGICLAKLSLLTLTREFKAGSPTASQGLLNL